MKHPNFHPTGMWHSTREKEIAAFLEGVKYEKAHSKAALSRMKKLNRQLINKIKELNDKRN